MVNLKELSCEELAESCKNGDMASIAILQQDLLDILEEKISIMKSYQAAVDKENEIKQRLEGLY